jgi:DNA polymerase-3 subunit epsilon
VVALVTRDESRKRQAQPPTYLQKLFAKAENNLVPNTDDSVTLAYTALLDRALEDRHIDDTEEKSLLDLATRWGIVGNQVREIHQKYLLQLAGVALGDGVISDSERYDLHKVACLLGYSTEELDGILEKASRILSREPTQAQPTLEPSRGEQLLGTQVCFTGEFQCRHAGMAITREMATELALNRGMIVVESVTKKLDLLVIADPLSQSGKAKKARKYGIRIMHEAVFWKALGIEIE